MTHPTPGHEVTNAKLLNKYFEILIWGDHRILNSHSIAAVPNRFEFRQEPTFVNIFLKYKFKS